MIDCNFRSYDLLAWFFSDVVDAGMIHDGSCLNMNGMKLHLDL